MKKTLVLAAVAALALSACGRMADLEPPQGATARQTERAPRDRQGAGPVEPGTVNLPPRELPIDSGASDPFGRPPRP